MATKKKVVVAKKPGKLDLGGGSGPAGAGSDLKGGGGSKGGGKSKKPAVKKTK